MSPIPFHRPRYLPSGEKANSKMGEFQQIQVEHLHSDLVLSDRLRGHRYISALPLLVRMDLDRD